MPTLEQDPAFQTEQRRTAALEQAWRDQKARTNELAKQLADLTARLEPALKLDDKISEVKATLDKFIVGPFAALEKLVRDVEAWVHKVKVDLGV